MNTIRVSNKLDPDQGQQDVSTNLGANCLQRLSADDKSHRSMERAYKNVCNLGGLFLFGHL